MAIVFKEEKLKPIRPNTALGPGQYLPISKSAKHKKNYAPFSSNTKKFQPLHSGFNKQIRDATPGPGKYYNDYFKQKAEKLELISTIKQLSQDGEFFEEYFLSKDSSNNKNKLQEKLGFDMKDFRFKKIPNLTPGPGNYFIDKNRNNNNFLIRSKTALYTNNDSLIKRTKNFEAKKKLKGKKEKLGPGSYELDNPQSWLKNGTSWSKMKSLRSNSVKTIISKETTRPQTSFGINMKINNIKTNNNIYQNKIKFQNIMIYNKAKENINKKIKEKDNTPGPGYYIDMNKNSDFSSKSIPLPLNKQFFGSDNARFEDNLKSNFWDSKYFFNNNKNEIYKNSNIINISNNNKMVNNRKKAAFISSEKRFTKISFLNQKNPYSNSDIKNPGPADYDPKPINDIFKNNFNNMNNTFNFRQKRFEPLITNNITWKIQTPGPGSYIDPYTGKGTSNSVYINGLHVDINRGKKLSKPKIKKSNSVINIKDETPGVGAYNIGIYDSIGYKNNVIKQKKNNIRKSSNFYESNYFKRKIENMKKNNNSLGLYKTKELDFMKFKQISPPFHASGKKMKDENKGYIVSPGQYESRSYFDWNKKSYNLSYLF